MTAKKPPDLHLAGVIADKIEDGTLFHSGIFSRSELAGKVRNLIAAAEQAQTEHTLAIPSACPHIIWYDDRDRPPEIFAGEGAKEAAERRFEQISESWNAHLFVSIAANSRDCPHPVATVADPHPQAQADAQTAALLEREAFEAWWRENVSQGLVEIDHDYRYWAIWQARA